MTSTRPSPGSTSSTTASGPFAPGVIGYLEDTGFPEFDPDEAEELVAQYEAETGGRSVLVHDHRHHQPLGGERHVADPGPDEEGRHRDGRSSPIEQAQQINTALGDDWQAQLWRNHPGGDPDTQYIWWYGGSPVNFNKFDDPEMNALLDQGRGEPDPAERQEIYEDINRDVRRSSSTTCGPTGRTGRSDRTPDVNGVLGPDLPDGSAPFPGLATGHPVSGHVDRPVILPAKQEPRRSARTGGAGGDLGRVS